VGRVERNGKQRMRDDGTNHRRKGKGGLRMTKRDQTMKREPAERGSSKALGPWSCEENEWGRDPKKGQVENGKQVLEKDRGWGENGKNNRKISERG